MMMDDTKKKITRNSNIGDFSGSLHLTSPVTVPEKSLISTHASVLVDSVGPPSAEVCRAAASFS
jgi:hypothetical protein